MWRHVSPNFIRPLFLRSALRPCKGQRQYVVTLLGFQQIMDQLDRKISKGGKSLERRSNVYEMLYARTHLVKLLTIKKIEILIGMLKD